MNEERQIYYGKTKERWMKGMKKKEEGKNEAATVTTVWWQFS